jgi:tellurite resistance protein TerC
LLVLVVVEVSDIAFSVDSIPAVFAVTTDPFIVFTSNVFALLTLRALYFVLAGATTRFHYLKPGLAVILVFVGAKMLLSEFVKISMLASLGVIVAVLAIVIAASLIQPATQQS